MQLNRTDFEKAIFRAIIVDMKKFLISRDRREEWITCDCPIKDVNWCNWMELLPANFVVSDIVDYIDEYEEKHGKIDTDI